MAVKQKQSDLEQLLQLLQLSSVAAEPQLREQQMADSRRGQDLQTALGLMGLENASAHEKAANDLALKQLLQHGTEFSQSQQLGREQLAQTGELGRSDIGVRQEANTLGREKLAQEGQQFTTAQAAESKRMTAQEALARLEASGHLLSNPNITSNEQMTGSLLNATSPELGKAYSTSKAAEHEAVFSAPGGIYDMADTLQAASGNSPEDDQKFMNFFKTLPPAHQVKALQHLGVGGPTLQPNETKAFIPLASNWKLRGPGQASTPFVNPFLPIIPTRPVDPNMSLLQALTGLSSAIITE